MPRDDREPHFGTHLDSPGFTLYTHLPGRFVLWKVGK